MVDVTLKMRTKAVEEPIRLAAGPGLRSTETLDLERAIQALPPRARTALLDLAAEVLGSLDEADTPSSLGRVRLFTPARRARTA